MLHAVQILRAGGFLSSRLSTPKFPLRDGEKVPGSGRNATPRSGAIFGGSMPSTLISGPAGGGNPHGQGSCWRTRPPQTIAADFTALFNALRLVERLPDGTFPVRAVADSVYLPLAEHMRLEVIEQARRRGLTSWAPIRTETAHVAGDCLRRSGLVPGRSSSTLAARLYRLGCRIRCRARWRRSARPPLAAGLNGCRATV